MQQPVSMADVAEIDSSAMQPLNDIQAAVQEPPHLFADLITLNFTAQSLDGQIVDLKLNGRHTAVTRDNYTEYVQLYTQYKTREIDVQIGAIKRGLSTIVPISVLPLYTYDELEQMICGKREIDIVYLRNNTRYRSPVQSSDQHVQWLWRALGEFHADERQKFLRFTWGQSRLPASAQEWTQKMEITPAAFDNDNALPVSHTWYDSTSTMHIVPHVACC